MKSRKSAVWVLLVVLAAAGTGLAGGWVPIDAPGASLTYLYGTDGSNVVGDYVDGSGWHGFLYDGTNWTPVDFPGSYLTAPFDIEGGRIVGTYNGWTEAHGFQYDGTTWGTIDFPGAPQTSIFGIDGGHIVGCYGLPGAYHGFLYDGIDWTSLDAPGASTTYAQGIDMDAGTSGIIVGFGQTGLDYGWLYDIDTKAFTPIYGPGGVLAQPFDIEGNNIIGSYRDGGAGDHGFLYDGTTWTTLDYPGAINTFPMRIRGGLIVGYYDPGDGSAHGFLYELEARVIEAGVDIDPDTFNLDSKGNWVTCYIDLPEEYDAKDIDVDSVSLEGLLEVQQSDIQDGVLMVKFDREDLAAYLEIVLGVVPPVDVELVVTGNLTDGTPFEGKDTIRVIDEGGK